MDSQGLARQRRDSGHRRREEGVGRRRTEGTVQSRLDAVDWGKKRGTETFANLPFTWTKRSRLRNVVSIVSSLRRTSVILRKGPAGVICGNERGDRLNRCRVASPHSGHFKSGSCHLISGPGMRHAVGLRCRVDLISSRLGKKFPS